MTTTRYEAPGTVADALSVMAAHPGAMILAGGTDLRGQYQAGGRKPAAFVDVKRIPELMKGLGRGIKDFKDASKGEEPSKETSKEEVK